MQEKPSEVAADSPTQSPPPFPGQAHSAADPAAITGRQPEVDKFTALKVFLIFHFLMTLFFCLGHLFSGLPQSLTQGYSLRNINLEFVRIITSGAHLASLVGIYKLKKWGWTVYKIVWGLSLLLHLMLGSLDLILLILFASVFTGIIYVLLNSGGANSAMKRLE